MKFIITAKPGNLRLLDDWIESSTLTEVVRCHAGLTKRYRSLNQVPLDDTFFEKKVNFLEYDRTNAQGKKQHFAWITDLPLSESTLETVMRGDRARWRIENETFNTLKNQGYEMRHNDGHGHQNLCSNLGLLMLLAF